MVIYRSKRRILFDAILLLFTARGSLGQVVPQECDLSFHLATTNTNNTVEFVGLTANDVGGNGTGSMLTCSCSATGLSPIKWHGPLGSPVSNGSFELTAGIQYMLVNHPGTAVQLHTTTNMFSCSEAGNYMCVIGENRREILVLPVGVECGPNNVTITPNPEEPLASGDTVTLQCSAVDPTGSVLGFRWFKDDRLISGQSSSALVLDAVEQGDTGTYTCQVSNRLGMKKQLFDLLLNFQGSEEQTAFPMSSDGLSLEIITTNVCFNRPVKLLCSHPLLVASGNFSTSQPSWKEDSNVVALDGSMYRSTSHINEKQVILELVPERSHFEPMGSHNYTCFFHFLGGGTLESNPVLVRPQDKPLQPRMLHGTPGIWDARIQWVNNDNQCFDSQDTCSLEYNITWFATSGGSVHSDATAHPKNEFTITGLRPDTEYTVTVKAQCQADKLLSSQESVVSFKTEDSKNAVLVLDTFNATTCFDRPLFLHCHHPDTTSHVEDIPVFDSMQVHWKRDGAVIAVDGSTYYIASHSNILTVLVVTYHRVDFRETTNNFSCFIPFENGTSLQSNEVQVYLNVSYARLYNWTTFGETLDWSHIVACSAIITPTTNFNVTVFLSSPGVRPYTHITSLTSLNIAEEANVSVPQAEVIAVSLQILEEEADTVNFTVNSSQEYACLGEIYKMNCTSTEPFNRCNISTPCWFKDSKLFTKACDNGHCKSYDAQTRELSVHVPHNGSTAHIYVCGAHRMPRPGCPHSNRFTVKPLRRPLTPVLENNTATETTLWFKWSHNKVCFSDCIVYNISWGPSSNNMVQKSMVVNGTNYTITNLTPGQNYSVQICAVCEGYDPNCTEPKENSTTVQVDPEPDLASAEIAGIVIAGIVLPIAIVVVIAII